jgi:hypothetical protein
MNPVPPLRSRYNGAVPRKVDYASRFAFLREAAFEVVLCKGVEALSRQSLATVQGVSASTIRRLVGADADLVVLAAEEVGSRRRQGRWLLPGTTPKDRAVSLLRTLLPDTDDRIAEELVWLRIVLSPRAGSGTPPFAPHPEGSLRRRYQVALSGYADPDPDGAMTVDSPSPELAQLVADRQAEVASTLDRAVGLLDMPEASHMQGVSELHLLVEGLTMAVCSGRLRPCEAVRAIEKTLNNSSRPHAGPF